MICFQLFSFSSQPRIFDSYLFLVLRASYQQSTVINRFGFFGARLLVWKSCLNWPWKILYIGIFGLSAWHSSNRQQLTLIVQYDQFQYHLLIQLNSLNMKLWNCQMSFRCAMRCHSRRKTRAAAVASNKKNPAWIRACVCNAKIIMFRLCQPALTQLKIIRIRYFGS